MRQPICLSRDPDAEALVTAVRATDQPALWQRGVELARAYIEERAAAAPPGPRVDCVEDASVPLADRSIAVRIYRPDAVTALPVVVYFHGGGWVLGSVESSDAFCRRVVDTAPCVLVSVDYRLAPEHPFPAAIDDAVGAIEWARAHAKWWGGDPERLIVLGDSAGGNLATVATRRLLGEGKDVVARQILAYPSVAADRRPSAAGLGAEWPLTDADRAWFFEHYVPDDTMRSDPDVAPLLADVAGMPPTTLLLGGCDPVVSEGIEYAKHLAMAAVSVDVHLYTGQIHGFLTFDESVLAGSREALELVAIAIWNTGRR
ncbi:MULTISPECIES: alpha/beta hydrolase [unclassified Mycobacterium]|uniref:alpha/beta hydrolase n=1 Tax=unclassified Mycobacterium TaxID=2642494 RepID=UPI0029C7DB53|nr:MULTISPECIES: alpha/beta hydrolase [unclassified Mycobacterium]